jgi:hypothetical protein
MPQPWKIQIGNVSVESAPTLPFPDKQLVQKIQGKLVNAIRMASEMVGAARMAIDKLAIVPPNTKLHRGNAEVLHALMKYFDLDPKATLYARTVKRILSVFDWINAGLSGGYRLCIYTAPNASSQMHSAMGYCTVDRGANQALGRLFLRDDHIDWKQFQALARGNRTASPSEEIHLKYEFLVGPNGADDTIAHTIVHEGSHKWAYTTDVCYKHNTAAKLAESPTALQDAVDHKIQKKVDRIIADDQALWISPGEQAETKPLFPMADPKRKANVPSMANAMQVKNANRMEKEMENLAKTDMWVKNADSYAYVARRLWKREAIISIAATGGKSAVLEAVKKPG